VDSSLAWRDVVEFGVSLPSRGPLARPEFVLTIAAKAEALRYASIFVSDHVVLPVSSARSVYPYSPTGKLPGGADQDYLEPLVMLGVLAQATRRIRLGTSVLVVPYRNPLLVAKMLATIDVVANGRVILGAGVGWLREEFEALGAPAFAERGRVTDDYLTLIRQAWSTDPTHFDAPHYKLEDVYVLPKPVQRPSIPIWIGGHTDGALERVARLGDGWHPIGLRPPAMLLPEEYAAKVARLHESARRAGRDPSSITLTFRAPMEVRGRRAKAPAGDRPVFQGTPDEVAADIARYQALGVSHFVFDATTQNLRAVLANLERFAHDVRPKVSRRRARATRTALASSSSRR
jgi:probable F420-dependent oxidoreductase